MYQQNLNLFFLEVFEDERKVLKVFLKEGFENEKFAHTFELLQQTIYIAAI